MPPTGDLASNPGMYPDWELNQRPFGSQAGTQSTEPDQLEHKIGSCFFYLGDKREWWGLGLTEELYLPSFVSL